MLLAAGAGDLEMCKWFVRVYLPGVEAYGAAREAAKNSHLHVLEWLAGEFDDTVDRTILSSAYQSGQAAVVDWIYQRWPSEPWFRDCWEENQMHRELMPELSLPLLQWTVEQGWTCDRFAIVMAANHSRMDITKWLASHLDQMYHRMMVRHNHGDCNCVRAGPGSSAGAVESVPKCLNKRAEGEVSVRNARRGLRDRYSNRADRVWFPQIFDLIHVATTGGDVEIIEWVRASNFPWLEFQSSDQVMNTAAEFGHYELVVWLHTHRSEGCTTDAMDSSAKNGDVKIVQFLHENRTEGCTQRAMHSAAFYGHLDVIKFLHENRAEGCTTYGIDFAASNGHLHVIQFLHENRSEGCTRAASQDAAANGHLDVIKWLSEYHSDLFTTKEMDNAAKNGHVHVVEWLRQNRSEGCSSSMIRLLAISRKFEMLRLLVVGRIKIDEDHRGMMGKRLQPMKCACGHKMPCS